MAEKHPSPYDVLGVSRDASQDDIRRAYRNLAKQHHPDLNPGNAKAEEKFKTVSSANQLLSDPEKRNQFDLGLIDHAGQPSQPSPSYRNYAENEAGRRYPPGGQDFDWGGHDPGDLFGSMFRGETPGRGRDNRYTMTTEFLEAVTGATKHITLPDGIEINVKIPPGTAEGQILRIRGKGGKGKSPGDALIEIKISPHRFFKRYGQDIRLDLPITIKEAVVGGAVQIPTPSGMVRMQIPPGSDTGTDLRLRGRGVPANADRATGDLYATLRVMVGKPDPALEEFLRAWKPEHLANPRQRMEDVL